MFDSGVTIQDIIDEVKSEVDVSEEISDSKYLHWFNSVEQLLYSEIIEEQAEFNVQLIPPDNSLVVFDLMSIKSSLFSSPRFEDIVSVHCDNIELSKTNFNSIEDMSNSYAKLGQDKLCINYDFDNTAADLKIVYNIRPSLSIPAVSYKKVTIPECNKQYKTIKRIDSGDGDILFYPIFNVNDCVNDIYGTEDELYEVYIDYSDNNETKRVYLKKTDIINDDNYTGNRYFISENNIIFTADDVFWGICSRGGFISFPVEPGEEFDKAFEKWLKSKTSELILRFEIKDSNSRNVLIPYEFLDMLRCKLRGEAYKLINEDGLAAKWLNEYNLWLENFKDYIKKRKSTYGF